MYKFYYSLSLVFLLTGLQMFSSPVFSSCRDAYPIGGGPNKNGHFPCPIKGVKDACSKEITNVPGAYCRDVKDDGCPKLELNICYVDE